jgi:hypothetical protein
MSVASAWPFSVLDGRRRRTRRSLMTRLRTSPAQTALGPANSAHSREPLDRLQVGIGGRAGITDGDRVVHRVTGHHASLRRHGEDLRQFGSVYLVAGIVAPSRPQASGLWW